MKATAIKPLSDFLRNSKAHIAELRQNHKVEVLTVNGFAAVVVQDPEAYEQMKALADRAIQDARLQSALAYFRDGGKGVEADKVFAQLDEKYARRSS